MRAASEIRRRYEKRLQATADALRARDLPVSARNVEACHGIWLGGRPFVCGRPAYCPCCLEYRLWKLARDDAERIRGRCHGFLRVVAGRPQLHTKSPTWRAVVLGHRKLWLPAQHTHLWVVVSNRPDIVTHYLNAQPSRLALKMLPVTYNEPLVELLQLDPAEAVRRASMRPPHFRAFEAAGIFRGGLKRKKRRIPVARL